MRCFLINVWFHLGNESGRGSLLYTLNFYGLLGKEVEMLKR